MHFHLVMDELMCFEFGEWNLSGAWKLEIKILLKEVENGSVVVSLGN